MILAVIILVAGFAINGFIDTKLGFKNHAYFTVTGFLIGILSTLAAVYSGI